MKIGMYLGAIGQKVVTCRPGDTALEVADKLKKNSIGAMPVLNEVGKLVGVISERDLIGKFSQHGADLVDMKVETMLTKSVIFMGPNADLSDAMKTMR